MAGAMLKTWWLLLLTFSAGGVWCQGISKSSDYYPLNGNGNGNGEKGLFPSVFNLAADADITANATCGMNEPEIYCKLVEHVYVRAPQCGICDDKNPDQRHPITNAIDGTNSWWQSPTLQNGRRFEWVTITLDLKQVFQVAYVIIKTGITPRPGNWILERSVDGVVWKAWQYYAISDNECISRYGIEPREGKPTYQSDSEVICTAYYSKLNPLEDGEIHTSLVNGRPGASLPSAELLNFTLARYVRLRLQKIRTLNADLMSLSSGNIRNASALAQTLNNPESDRSLYRRFFYSIKDISIGGQCVCFGHAATCPYDPELDRAKCQCEHNTCGESCDRCCPLFNQRPWRPGTSNDSGVCEQCQCHGHAKQCYYDPQVDRENLSLNINNVYSGGGVCLNCTDFTTGINCERCIDGYYRPKGVGPDARQPCLPCGCSSAGSIGNCVKDTSRQDDGLSPGQCICKEGYAGTRCDKCAKGYRGFPNCEPCPCNTAGIIDPNCSTPCKCKANVEGERCDYCIAGYFDLQESNAEGCTKCFCFDRSGRCISSDLGIIKVNSKKGWLVTDLLGRRVVSPYMENNRLLIANDDMAEYESYYWLAPADYVGKKLTSYAQTMKFLVSWVQARGDTAGKSTKGPDVILEGSGMKIGYGDRAYRDSNVTITFAMREKSWYHIPDTVQDIARKRRTEYKGEAVTKAQFMAIINDLQRLMIRAKFHTDQIEGILHDADMNMGSENSLSGERARGIEQCTCPPGYTGLSCEECDFGYVRLNQTRGQFECVECNCNGHAATCDLDLGTCGPCLHNTHGPHCEFCLPGYYGDPRTGKPDACKRCRCPLEIPSNNFSPTCVSTGSDSYICDACPDGYEGNHCERCADGFFGNPLVPGGYCQPCDCNKNHEIGSTDWCDRLTGQCLKCKPDTTGVACELCKPGYYGNALQGTCKACRCSELGSINQQCDLETGQCLCKERFTGQHCDRCKDGYGNIATGCQQCNCDPLGSLTISTCNQETGQCQCREGVGGLKCNQCLDNHYGFSINGCQRCACNEQGSRSRSCDIVTGQCQCKANVIGLTCNQCKEGHWNLQAGQGCQPCSCDSTGSLNGTCDAAGFCYCLPGIGGRYCDQCLAGYFGFSSSGCKECEPCDKPGHICDPDTGRCVCPPLTEGPQCQTCSAGAWNYNSLKGCQACNCHAQGSKSGQCDPTNGSCLCREGYEGPQCDRCQAGFYGFPNCLKCDCNPAGTESRACNSKGVCQCGSDGQCPCKANVNGRTCNLCKSATFGLQQENVDGCTPCYCFTRSNACTQANYIWTQLRVEGGRGLMITYDHPLRPPNAISANQFPVNTQEICYINLALPGNQEMRFKAGETQLNVTNNLRIIPGQDGDVMIGVSQMFDTPLYWKLPEIFLRDKVLSYGGYLRFTIHNDGGSTLLPNNILATYPLIQIQGNRKIILEYYPGALNPTGRYEVRLHESLWRMRNNPRGHVTREMFMIALQNLQHVLIRATDSMDRAKANLSDISLDIAVPAPSNSSPLNLARGIELCQCPEGYNATSCQDPSRGYYRRYKHDYISSTVIIDLVGEAHPCQCNGRSEVCDKETGHCLYCRENTSGRSCGECAAGFYGDPKTGPCKPCACPSADRNFAVGCETLRNGTHKCSCKTGYRGDRCERCDYGFYGNPRSPAGYCQPCNCDANGSVSDECDEITGQCNCKPGITGRDCTYCAPRHVISQDGCTSCEGGCTGILFQEIDALSRSVSHINFDDFVPLPWNAIFGHENTSIILERDLIVRKKENEIIDNLINAPNLFPLAQITLQRIKESEIQTIKLKSDASALQPRCTQSYTETIDIQRSVEEIVAYLKNYAIGETPSINILKAMTEAENHLSYIQSIDVVSRKTNALRELERSRNLLESCQNLIVETNGVGNLRDYLEGFKIRLDDLDFHIRRSSNNSVTVFQMLSRSNLTFNEIRRWILDLTSIATKIDLQINLCRKLNANASLALTTSRITFQSLKQSSVVLANRTILCKIKEGDLSRSNPELESEYVTPAKQHADALWKQAQKLFNQFNATRDVADLPLQAANAYKSIVDALRQARIAAEAASEAAETAYHEAYPNDLDLSLVERARMSREKSRDLLLESERLKATVAEHKNRLKGEQFTLRTVEAILRKAKTSNDDTNAALGKLVKIRDRAKAAVEKSANSLTKATITSRRVMNTSSLVESELRAKLLIMQNVRDVGIGNIPKLIEETRKNLKSIESKMSQFTKKQMENRGINSTLNLKLDDLRKKIMRAKQAASSIRVSLSGKSGRCSRTFTPPLQPSTLSKIVMTFAINHQDKDSLLFYLPASKKHPNDAEIDFLAMEMVNRQIRFLWNVGGSTTVLTNPLTLLPSPDDLSDDARWYKIEAERNGNIGTLTVRPVKLDENSFTDSQRRRNGRGDADGAVKVSATGPPRYTKLDIAPGDTLYIGKLPPNPPADLKTSKFSGNIHQLWFDGQPIGLWNFNKSTSCAAAIEGAQEARDESSFHFNGQGYAELAQIPRYDSRQYSVTFSFKSLDENALLFLAINETVGQYISLELTEGLLRYEVRYGSNYELSLQSRKRYNTGQWIKVEASRVLLRGVETALLKVADDEELSAAPFNFGVPDLELEEARLYIGGIPPTVRIPSTLMASVPGSFLGCIKDLQVVAFGMNPLQGSYYGVEASCSDSRNKIVGLPGHGYLQLRAPSPKKDFNMGFSFKTKTTDGILLYAFPVPAEFNDESQMSLEEETNFISMAMKGDKDADILSVSIRQGKLDGRFKSGGSETVSIVSANTYYDDVFHNVVIVRTGKRVEMFVDDISIGVARLNRVASSNQGDTFLMIGGIRPEMGTMAHDFIGIQNSLTGCIADVIYNNDLLDMSEPVKHRGAAVGRCVYIPVARDIEERMQANEKALSSCREVPQYTIEGRSVKFGDAPNSHVIISANRKELQTSFNFTLDFRTHYPNGLLLYAPMKQKMISYFLVALKNGRIVISLSGRRKENLVSNTNVNDGNWHKVHILKNKRKLTLIVDDFGPLRTKSPKKMQFDGQMYIGGLPENTQHFLDTTASESFKGCIRNLNLNGRSYDLASSKNVIHRVGQCFAHVETGSYFPGDAYAVYSNNFRLGAMADIQLEFRTTELNGILLSVSERKGSPSLSLSIDDGTVVFAVDMGDNNTFTVRQSFPSPYQVCDNRWHSVKASYVENALTLKLDNLDEQYGFSHNGHVRETKTRNPLFIGGLPEFEPQGSLRVRDNFKGCIRNVVIRGEIKDWTDMARLNNVLLNACPIH